jgi:hypothetical protein
LDRSTDEVDPTNPALRRPQSRPAAHRRYRARNAIRQVWRAKMRCHYDGTPAR